MSKCRAYQEWLSAPVIDNSIYVLRASSNYAGLYMVKNRTTGRRVMNRDESITHPHRQYFTHYAALEEIRLLNAGIVEVSYVD